MRISEEKNAQAKGIQRTAAGGCFGSLCDVSIRTRMRDSRARVDVLREKAESRTKLVCGNVREDGAAKRSTVRE